MKVAIIGTVGIPANYGGFETLAEQLVDNLHTPQLKYTVYCSSASYAEKAKEFNGAELRYIPLRANGLQSIPYDILSLVKAARSHDAILMLGVSGAAFLPIFRLFSKKRLIVNIDGLEHRRDKWKPWVRRFLKYSEKQAVKYADVVVSDNAAIQRYVKEEYGIDSECIAYGADHVDTSISKTDSEAVLKEYGLKSKEYSMGLCRIEPENNVAMILEAFSKMPERQLIFFGNWTHSDYARALHQKYSAFSNIRLIQALYDSSKIDVLRANCQVYIHGHSAGGTNPSLVEAMYFGVPIICYDCVYNRETTEGKALYFSNSDKLRKLLTDTADLESVAEAMRLTATGRYRWRKIADSYEKLFIP